MATRTPLIAGNWKLHKDCAESVAFAHELKSAIGADTDVDVMVAPTFTALYPVCEALKGSPIAVAAQDMFWESKGAWTGEISAEMIRSCGCTHVIIGHSERRQYFGETDETVNAKLKSALEAGLVPVVCIGETDEERKQGKTFEVLDTQVKMGLKGLSAEELASVVLAYEPVWAIGTGNTATPDMVQEVHAFLRKSVADSLQKELANAMRILYGGSVKSGNIAELMALEDVDGALVGGASLDTESFSGIVRYKR
ncbi:triose-phosphate isomerase [Desulfoluna spongiiphila]|uniref:Triosephosphate isomerase n=1 Tax=Desulfoluna spongiiphila TaxID=419481 RepID=A0A1G5JDN7_9BACT|nr:triose-phosphate isomerase [Desulfoluna spongiiphila]SCY86050.1 triosephosphate isomerase [Desulfoluna spongiiphila]